jgi:hypothetical protein
MKIDESMIKKGSAVCFEYRGVLVTVIPRHFPKSEFYRPLLKVDEGHFLKKHYRVRARRTHMPVF